MSIRARLTIWYTGILAATLIVFGSGCVVGLLAFSKFLRWLLAWLYRVEVIAHEVLVTEGDLFLFQCFLGTLVEVKKDILELDGRAAGDLDTVVDVTRQRQAGHYHNMTNIGAGMRVRMCDRYAFYFEYETASLKSIDIAYADIDATANSALINSTSRTANVTLKPNYSMVSVSFEFPIEFCLRCKDAGGQNRGGTPGW